MKEELLIGSHVSFAGKDMFVGAVNEALSYQATTMMVYTGAPQNTRRKKIEEMKIAEGQQLMKANGLTTVVVHAPYIINLGNTIKPEMFPFAIQFLKEEIERAEALGATQMTLHPGAHVGAGEEAGIKRIIEGLNEVLTKEQRVQIALETMAGKGTELGKTFEELAQIIDGVQLNEKLSVTFDTCHTNDAGYDVAHQFDEVLNTFDKIIGIDRLKVLHVNDSKNPQGSHKDRHANIGFGTIGFDTLHAIVHHPQLQQVPKILETPYVGKDKKTAYAPYGKEIAMLRQGQFDPQIFPELVATEND